MAERRYLGGISLRDGATETPIDGPLLLSCESATFFRNRRGVYVIATGRGLEHHIDAFEAAPPDPQPASLTFNVSVEDPSGRYLPRRFALRLPRAAPGELVVVPMYRSPSAAVSPNWALVRGKLVSAPDQPLPAAVVRVVRDSDGAVVARSHSVPALGERDRTPISARLQGEIAVPLVGIPVSLWGDDNERSVLVDEVEMTLEVVPVSVGDPLIDPDEHFGTDALTVNRFPVRVASGREVNAGTLSVTVS